MLTVAAFFPSSICLISADELEPDCTSHFRRISLALVKQTASSYAVGQDVA